MAATKRSLTLIDGGGSLPAELDASLVGAIKRYVDAVVSPLREKILVQEAEIGALRAKEPQPGRDGLPGVPGPAGRDGRDGAPGQDGLGFDDLEVTHDGERTVTFKFIRGERVRQFPITFPAMLYRGVHKEGALYMVGDTVTWAGGLWYCNEATTVKPGSGARQWTLATKKGADGRNGKSAYEVAVEHGFKGSEKEWLKSLQGPPGPRGQDLRHLMPG